MSLGEFLSTIDPRQRLLNRIVSLWYFNNAKLVVKVSLTSVEIQL